jgi:hypothetical protein
MMIHLSAAPKPCEFAVPPAQQENPALWEFSGALPGLKD